MDETWIVISILTIIGTVINIQLLNHNWFKRQELKSKYKVKEIRERTKAKLPRKTLSQENITSAPFSNISGLLNLAKGLDPEQIHDIVDTLTGSATPETSGDVLQDIITNNPELVQSFIDGFAKGKKPEAGEQFKGQYEND